MRSRDAHHSSMMLQAADTIAYEIFKHTENQWLDLGKRPVRLSMIDLIRPKVLVALGATAVEGLLGKTVGITKLRGNWQTYRDTPLMPTYHPAYLLRNQAMSEKRRVWEDMLAVMEKLGMPISEKQRGYFLKG